MKNYSLSLYLIQNFALGGCFGSQYNLVPCAYSCATLCDLIFHEGFADLKRLQAISRVQPTVYNVELAAQNP